MKNTPYITRLASVIFLAADSPRAVLRHLYNQAYGFLTQPISFLIRYTLDEGPSRSGP